MTPTPDEGNVSVGDRLLRTPAVLEAKGGLVNMKGYGPSRKSIRVEIQGKGAWLTGGSSPRRLYKGLLEITAEKGRLKILNTIPLETYIAGVVSAEAGDLSQTEAFKAQAVAARTYVLKHMHNHVRDGYNMCDSTHCQFFPGFAAVRPIAQAAADFTRGEIVTYRGKPAATFYHSICGGRTETMTAVWPFEHKPYLISVRDGPEKKPYCSIAPAFNWKTRISLKTLSAIARARGWILPEEEIKKMSVAARGVSRRATTLEFDTGKRMVRIPATRFYHGTGRRAGWKPCAALFSNVLGKNI